MVQVSKRKREARYALDPYLGQYVEATALVWEREEDKYHRIRLILKDVRLRGKLVAHHIWLEEDDAKMFAIYANGKRVRFVAQVYRYQRAIDDAYAWRYGLHNIVQVRREKATRDRGKKEIHNDTQ